MNKENKNLIKFIESKGFYRDIEDNVWYTRDYKQRVVPQFFNKNFSHLYYSNGFNKSISFRSVDELEKIIMKSCMKKEIE